MKTVIMAGGKGTRISSIASDIPKPMIKINNKPVLEYEIECLRSQGFDDIIITVSHLGSIIMNYFGDGSGVSPVTGQEFGVKISYYFEEKPLGNAGALFELWRDGQLGESGSDFLLLNADTVFDVDFNRFVTFHQDRKAVATLFTHPNSHPYDSALIITDDECRVKEWLTKEDTRPVYYKNRANAGLHVLNTAIFNTVKIDDSLIGLQDNEGKIIKVDLDREILKPLLYTGKIFAYDSPEYVKDMGTPERYYTVCSDFSSGKVHVKNLRNKQRAIFLDRDGTINEHVGFLRDIEKFNLLEGVAEAMKQINNSEYLAIVVTNQPVIARGEVTIDNLNLIHNKMETILGNEGAYVDAIYYCPHHPDRGFEGEITELKIDCNCRKPKPGLLIHAAYDFNIDLVNSWMIGDEERDIKAGKAAGCKTILINKNHYNYGQDETVSSLIEAVKFICRNEREK